MQQLDSHNSYWAQKKDTSTKVDDNMKLDCKKRMKKKKEEKEKEKGALMLAIGRGMIAAPWI